MSLTSWRANALLRDHTPTVAEVKQLLDVVDRDLADAALTQVSADNRFVHAYNAGLQLCVLALHASGYAVPKGQSHHVRSLESLPLTLGADQEEVARYLDVCSRKRHQIEYERARVVEAAQADELTQAVAKLRADVVAWLKLTHPGLVPAGI